MPTPRNVQRDEANWLLTALPDHAYARVANHLEPVKLAIHDTIFEPDASIDYAYFPQAGCLSMFLAAQLTTAGFPPKLIETSATVHLDAGPAISRIELEMSAEVPGVSQGLFDEKLAFSKANCPISKALASVPSITVNAKLKA